MSFTFVVEDGTGLSNSNSYVSVAEAETYLIQNIHVYPSWEALETSTKQAILAWSTRYLDQRARWNGVKTEEDSALRWPRTGVFNADGISIPSDEIPKQLKDATIEMARYLLEGDRAADRGQDGLKEVQVDVIRLVFNENYRLPEVPNEINQILKNLGYIMGGPNSFAKIRRA